MSLLISVSIAVSAIVLLFLFDRGLPNCARTIALRLLKYAARADARQSARRAAHLIVLSNLAAAARLITDSTVPFPADRPCDPPPFLLGDTTLPMGAGVRIHTSAVRNRAHVNGQST